MILKNAPQSWNFPSVIIQYWFPVFPPSVLHQKHKKCTKRHRYREPGRRPRTHRRRRPPPLKRYAGDVLAPVSLPEIKVHHSSWDFDKKEKLFNALGNDSNRSVSPSCLPLRVISRDFRSTRWERAPPPAVSAPSHTLWSILTLRRAPWCLWLLPRPSSPSEGRHGMNYLFCFHGNNSASSSAAVIPCWNRLRPIINMRTVWFRILRDGSSEWWQDNITCI